MTKIKASERRWARGILDELVSNSFNAGAGKIDVQVRARADNIEIKVDDDGVGMDRETVRQVEGLLQQPRREELEEYYGDLAGVSGYGSGLTIVGMLVDEAEVKSVPGKGTTIRVRRWF
ncbi:MAG: ATP-binding protein [Firmicutes bacterium]|nr:ATP-binding protein [Bacillota bacterium]